MRLDEITKAQGTSWKKRELRRKVCIVLLQKERKCEIVIKENGGSESSKETQYDFQAALKAHLKFIVYI